MLGSTPHGNQHGAGPKRPRRLHRDEIEQGPHPADGATETVNRQSRPSGLEGVAKPHRLSCFDEIAVDDADIPT